MLLIEMKIIIIIIFPLNNLHHHHILTQICVAVQCHEGNWTSLVALMALLAEETPSSSNRCQHQHQYFLSYHHDHSHDWGHIPCSRQHVVSMSSSSSASWFLYHKHHHQHRGQRQSSSYSDRPLCPRLNGRLVYS